MSMCQNSQNYFFFASYSRFLRNFFTKKPGRNGGKSVKKYHVGTLQATVSLVWVATATKARNSCFLVFLNFLFLGKKWGTRNKKSMFFTFCLIQAKIWPFLVIFSKYYDNNTYFCCFVVIFGMSFCISSSFGGKELDRFDFVCSDFTNLQQYMQ